MLIWRIIFSYEADGRFRITNRSPKWITKARMQTQCPSSCGMRISQRRASRMCPRPMRSSEVWKALNKVFLKRLAEGWFAPLDPADAYHYVVEKLIKKLDSDKYKASKDKTAYLITAMCGSLIEFGSRQVVRARLNDKCLSNWQGKWQRSMDSQKKRPMSSPSLR